MGGRIGGIQKGLSKFDGPSVRACLRNARCMTLSLAAAIVTSSCATAGASSNGLMKRDIAVLRAVLKSEVCGRADRKYQIVSDQPASATRASIPQTWHSGAELNKELARRSEEGSSWPHVDICSTVRIFDGSRIEAMFAAGNRIPPSWDSFNDAFPDADGLVKVSLPVFFADGKSAVVYLVKQCGVLCGAGFYIELKQTTAEWQVSRREAAWIS